MSENTLTDAITEAYNELEPTEVDNLEVSEDEEVVELTLDDVDDVTEEDLDTETLDEDIEEGDVEESDSNETFVVKVDGEELSVSIDELKSGYQRQAHFTKSMQALKDERETFEQEASQFIEQVKSIQELDNAWTNNPVEVLSNLLSSTESPEYTLGLVIKELAAADALSPEALQYFGIDEATKKEWSSESEIQRLRREVEVTQQVEKLKLTEAQAAQAEQQINKVMQEYDNTINDIIVEEALDLPTSTEKLYFKTELLKYAKDSNILDLRKAYAAMQYENSKTQRAEAQRRAESSKKKSTTKVISKGGASQSSTSKVSDGKQDLRSIIEETMKEINI